VARCNSNCSSDQSILYGAILNATLWTTGALKFFWIGLKRHTTRAIHVTKMEHPNPEHTNPEHTNPEHTNPEHTNPEHPNPEHTNPDHTNPEHPNPDHPNPEHPNPCNRLATIHQRLF